MLDSQGSLGRIGVIVAARTGSTRLTGKALLPLAGKPMILFLLDRIRASRRSDVICFATTELEEDGHLAATVKSAGYPVFRGANRDVVARYVDAAAAHRLDHVVRITGDCPFVDAESLDYCIDQAARLAPFELATTKGTFPVGIDYEIYNAATMSQLHASGQLDEEAREHLTLYLYQHAERFCTIQLQPRVEWRSPQIFTVDTAEDYVRAEDIATRLGSDVAITQLSRVCG